MNVRKSEQAQTKHLDSSMERTPHCEKHSTSQPRCKAKSKQTTIDQLGLSVLCNLLHRLEQVAIQLWVAQLLCNSATAHDRHATKVLQQGCATKVYVCHWG